MLRRKIEKNLTDWVKNSRKALLIDGARQVGKTFIIRSVLQAEGCEYAEFNLIQTPALCNILSDCNTVDDLIASLSLFTDKKLVKGETFLFFDEIQECSDLVSKVKFWVEEGSFRYIFSGSLLGVALKNIRSAPVGYMTSLTMYPLDFEEFLQLYHFTEELRDSLYRSFSERQPVNEAVHQRLMKIFHTYLIVGGMPAAVSRFAETRDLEEVAAEHGDIIEQYKRDFTRYETEDKKPYLTQIYQLIPAELNEKNKRFSINSLQQGLRFAKGEDSFVWLADAGVALPVYNVTEPVVPLVLNQKSSLFKLFLSDVGLLTTQFGKAAKLQLLSDGGDINNGALYENAVAQELKAHGFPLYYYNSKKYGELDFVIEYRGGILPIEVKSGKEYQRHSALTNVMEISNYPLREAFVFTSYNVRVVDRCVYYPIYMVMFLDNGDLRLPRIELDDLSAPMQ